MPATLEKLTTARAARVAGCSEQTIRSWVRRGVLPAELTPYGLLVAEDDFAALIAQREAAARETSR